jgi:DnaJ-class molecular chaperone
MNRYPITTAVLPVLEPACRTCHGSGSIVAGVEAHTGNVSGDECPTCHGSGTALASIMDAHDAASCGFCRANALVVDHRRDVWSW